MRLSEIQHIENSIIILGLDEKYHLEVLGYLWEKGFSQCVFPYNGIGFRELLTVIEYENELREDSEVYKNLYSYEEAVRKGIRG